MERGGLTLTNISSPLDSRLTLTWYPQAEFEKRGLRAVLRKGGKQLASLDGMRGARFPESWYCPRCDQVVGLFPVETGRQAGTF